MSTLRQASIKTWNGNDSIEHINAGSFQRIADACEVMSKNHAELISEAKRYKEWYIHERERNASLTRKVSALHGVITKLKKGKNK